MRKLPSNYLLKRPFMCYTNTMTTKRLVRIAFFVMLTIVGGLIRIPVPFTPISFTLQTFFVVASGMILGGRDGTFAQLGYVVLGLIGLPVFTAGGGPAYVLQPSFGYILSFPLAAFFAGSLVSKQKTLHSFKLFLCGFAGVLVNYVVGIAYQIVILVLYTHSSIGAAFGTVPSVLLMLVKDAVLVYLLCLLYPRIMKTIGHLDEQNKPIGKEREEAATPPQGEETDEPEAKKEPKRDPVPEPANMSANACRKRRT